MKLNAPPINLAHLDYLSPTVMVDGEPVLMTAIYADAPSYKPIGAPGEGIVCVDDVARAAIVYVDQHAKTGDPKDLAQARAALNFTMRMQQPDGKFYNFVTDNKGTINKDGHTSSLGLGWWAMRGMWALAHGYQTFKSADPEYAARILSAYNRTEKALAADLAQGAGTTVNVRGAKVPAWVSRLPADQASIAALALADMQQARPNPETASTLARVADGIAALRTEAGKTGAFTHMAHTTSSPERWHAWGAAEPWALARAGEVLGRKDLAQTARTAVDGLLAWQLAGGRIHELTPLPIREGQQSYGVNAAVQAAMAVHRATPGDMKYAQMAGLTAAWLSGANMARAPLYDPATGRGYDGIDVISTARPNGVNMSSGAESTIESLMALQAISGNSVAERAAGAKIESQKSWVSVAAAEQAKQQGRSVVSTLASPNAGEPKVEMAALAPGESLTLKVNIPHDGSYRLLAASMVPKTGATAPKLQFSVHGSRSGTLDRRSADGPHVALDLVPGARHNLKAGPTEIRIDAVGGKESAPALVQGITFHPEKVRTDYVLPGGEKITASFHPKTGFAMKPTPVPARTTRPA